MTCILIHSNINLTDLWVLTQQSIQIYQILKEKIHTYYVNMRREKYIQMLKRKAIKILQAISTTIQVHPICKRGMITCI